MTTNFFIPRSVLERLSKDNRFSKTAREGLARSIPLDDAIRRVRKHASAVTRVEQSLAFQGGPLAAQPTPQNLVYDCQHSKALPGSPVANPAGSADPVAKDAFALSADLIRFYATVFHRNSIDGAGMSLISSIHYGTGYNNAFWNGSQMTYGDGDGHIFINFTKSDDVIGHELTHGVTQHTLQLGYDNQAGGLNESLSDVFGSMFRQWRADQTVTQADWLIGSGILGPDAKSKGYTCLCNMRNPADKAALSPQPIDMSGYQNGMDPHESSGIPNRAFALASVAIGGKSWEKCGQIWYMAMTGGKPSPSMKMKSFANRTRKAAASLYPGDAATAQAIDTAWKTVGL